MGLDLFLIIYMEHVYIGIYVHMCIYTYVCISHLHRWTYMHIHAYIFIQGCAVYAQLQYLSSLLLAAHFCFVIVATCLRKKNRPGRKKENPVQLQETKREDFYVYFHTHQLLDQFCGIAVQIKVPVQCTGLLGEQGLPELP